MQDAMEEQLLKKWWVSRHAITISAKASPNSPSKTASHAFDFIAND